MKKFLLILLIVLVLVGSIFWFLFFYKRKDLAYKVAKMRVCPDAWFDNQIPIIGEKPIETQYFIINGERVEKDKVDVDWVKKNCPINKPQQIF